MAKAKNSYAGLYKKSPAVMLLDEATNAPGARSERGIINAVESLKLRTHATVAHRLPTELNSDTIVIIGKGRVVEMGTHAPLQAAKTIYSRLSNSILSRKICFDGFWVFWENLGEEFENESFGKCDVLGRKYIGKHEYV